MMKARLYIAAFLACLLPSALLADNYSRKVNTLIGTDYTGNTYPGRKLRLAWCSSAPTTDCRDGTA